jgi:hypothetical protein
MVELIRVAPLAHMTQTPAGRVTVTLMGVSTGYGKGCCILGSHPPQELCRKVPDFLLVFFSFPSEERSNTNITQSPPHTHNCSRAHSLQARASWSPPLLGGPPPYSQAWVLASPK